MRVLIYGSRTWRDFDAIRALVRDLPHHAVVIHGGCPSGADAIADEEAAGRGLRVESFPVDHRLDGTWPAAGPRRNSRMLAVGRPEIGFGFRSEGESRGTDDMTRKLRAKGIPALVMLEGGVGEAEGLKTSEVEWEQLQIEEA